MKQEYQVLVRMTETVTSVREVLVDVVGNDLEDAMDRAYELAERGEYDEHLADIKDEIDSEVVYQVGV